jgi:hypothetical protein
MWKEYHTHDFLSIFLSNEKLLFGNNKSVVAIVVVPRTQRLYMCVHKHTYTEALTVFYFCFHRKRKSQPTTLGPRKARETEKKRKTDFPETCLRVK